MLADIFGEPSLKAYRYKGLRTFSVGISVDGTRLGAEGQIPLAVFDADDETELPRQLQEAIQASRGRQNEVYWVFALTPQIDDLVTGYHASGQMIAKYQQIQSQNKITNEEAASLAAERNEHNRLRGRLRDKLAEALASGRGVFRGVTKDASDLGRTTTDIFRGLYEWVVPDLYPKLELGARSLTGKEAEEVLRAANLQGLPPVFYGGDDGLDLIVQEGQRYAVNTAAPIAKEALDYLKQEHAYGNRVTGKTIEQHFGGLGYGWELDALKLVLAALLRAGSIEMTYQGRRFRDAQDPQSRTPFSGTVAFRAASFAPREAIGLKTLVAAATQLEQLTGKEVDVEEGTIATAFKALAAEELNALLPVVAEANAHRLPVAEALDDYRSALQEVQSAASDDAVRILAGEGNSFKQMRDTARRIREAITPDNVRIIQRARTVGAGMWPVLRGRPEGQQVQEQIEEVAALSSSPDFYEHLARLDALAKVVEDRYRALYESKHAERAAAFTQAIEEIKGHPEWAQIPAETADSLLQPLTSRACACLDLPRGSVACRTCHATVTQLESDLAALSGLTGQVLARLQELTAPEQTIERVRLASFFDGALDSTDAVDAAVGRLRDHLLKLVEAHVRVVVE